MEKGKQRIILITLLAISGVLFIVGLFTAFMLNYNIFAPSEIKILDDGENIYVTTSANDNYLSYRFKFTRKEEEDVLEEILIDADKNILSIEEILASDVEVGQTYMISSCYLSENEGNNSQYSLPIEWKVYVNLQKTILSYNEGTEKLVWQEVDGADYYTLNYNDKEEIKSIVVEDTVYDLDKIPGGERTFYVVAFSNDENYKQSKSSNTIEIQGGVVHKYKEFISVEFDKSTCTLTVYSYENLSSFCVFIDEKEYEVNMFDSYFDPENSIYVFSVNLQTIYKEDSTIGASPKTLDEYNIFDGDISYVNTEEAE